MITLFIFPPAFGLRNVSPFCLKLEMLLTHLKLDFEIQIEGDPRKGPKQKLPFMDMAGERLADSEIIYELLDKKTDGALFAGLSAAEKAKGTAFTRLVEDHLYWLLVASRWLDDDWFENVRRDFFGFLPFFLEGFIANSARKTVQKTYELQGLGRHTLEQQKNFTLRDLQAISDVVSESNYIVGNRLTVFDFSVSALIAGMVDQQPVSWINEIVDRFPALNEYAERVQKEVGVYARLES